MTRTHRARRMRGAITATATAALATSLVLVPAAAFAAPADNGGSTRNNPEVDRTQQIRDALVGGSAKNVILLIGDGMGDSEITVARNYAEGAAGKFAGIDALPFTGQYTTYALNKDGTPNYASESASTASGWATGTKTYNGALSVDIKDKPQSTLLEIAKANGKKTGNVSTAEIQDATPGAQISHISARGCYGPEQTTKSCTSEALENGGLGSISEQLLNLRPDVVLGGGAASFGQLAKAGPWANKSLFDQANERGYNVIRDAAGLEKVTEANADKPVLGLFTEGNFPTRYVGPAATVGGGDLAPVSCAPNPEKLDPKLSLGSLTNKAVGLLKNNDKGFFLQVEGASIDKRDHAADACGQIGETVDLDEAVKEALAFAKADGNTLVVVTADHAHTSQILGGTPPGLSVALKTNEGQKMIVGYGTANAGESQQHTGSQVRIAASGPGAANVLGLTDQTDLFFTSARGLDRNLVSLSANATATPNLTTVKPGEKFTVTVAGLAADWQAKGSDSSQLDVKNGKAVFTVTAPAETGKFEFSITGVQTKTALKASVQVGSETVVAPPAPAGTDGAGTVGDPQAAQGPSGSLPLTGAQVLPLAALAIALLMAGATAVYVVQRRRRATNEA